jgi:hypothetical protein
MGSRDRTMPHRCASKSLFTISERFLFPFSRKRECVFSLLPQAGEGARRADEGHPPRTHYRSTREYISSMHRM